MLANCRLVLQPFSKRFPRCAATMFRSLRVRSIDPDPERPKKPLSGYTRFLQKQRAIDPKITMAGISMGWKELPASERQPYVDMFLADQKVYQTELERYKSSGKEERWRRPEGMPKRPQTGYLRFYNEYRKQNLEAAQAYNVKAFAKITSAAWQALNPDDRKMFNDLYRKDLYEFNEKMRLWKESGALEVWREKVGLTRVERLKQLRIDRKTLRARKERQKIFNQNKALSDRLRKVHRDEKERRDHVRKKTKALRDRNLEKVRKVEATIKRVRTQMMERLKKLESESKTIRREVAKQTEIIAKINRPRLPRVYGKKMVNTSGKEWDFLKAKLNEKKKTP